MSRASATGAARTWTASLAVLVGVGTASALAACGEPRQAPVEHPRGCGTYEPVKAPVGPQRDDPGYGYEMDDDALCPR